MKKLLTLSIAIFMVVSVFAMSVSAAPKATVDVKKGTAVVDGKIDDIWQYAAEMKLDRVNNGTAPGATGYAKLLWDDNNLYGLVVIEDKTKSMQTTALHLEDCLEVFFDFDNKKAGGNFTMDNQFRVLYDGFTPIETGMRNQTNLNTGYADNIKFALGEPTATQYVYEFSINAKALKNNYAFKADALIGIDFGFDDNTMNDNVRTGSISWNADGNVSADVALAGTVKLVNVSAQPATTTAAATTKAATGGTTAPKTGDPMAIIALLSAVSATGVIVIGKKRSK